MDRPAGSVAPHSDRGGGLRRLGASHDPPFPVGLATSVALHAVALFVISILPRAQPVPPPPMYWLLLDETPQGMGVIDIQGGGGGEERREEARPAPPLRAPAPEETTGQGPVRVPAEGPVGPPSAGTGGTNLGAASGTGSGGAPLTAAERMRPALQDGRLWAPLDRGINALSTEQREELELSGRIAEWQDSVAAAAAAESALTDWTKTDAEGKRWGISPGAIHLGDVTIPLPFAFGTPIGQRDAVRQRAWEWEEITRGAASGAVRESWKDRAQAIRERRDRERAQAKPDTIPSRR